MAGRVLLISGAKDAVGSFAARSVRASVEAHTRIFDNFSMLIKS